MKMGPTAVAALAMGDGAVPPGPAPTADDGIDSAGDLFALPLRLVRQGGPSPNDYEPLRDWLARIHRLVAAGRVARGDVTAFWRALGPQYLSGSTQGFALAKPYGYAGDFEIMDRIYR